MTTPWSERLAQMWNAGSCMVRGCLQPRRRVSGMCKNHQLHLFRFEDPLARKISKAEVKPYFRLMDKAIRENMRLVLEALDDLLQRATDAASRIHSKPRRGDLHGLVYLELARLHTCGLTPMQAFVTASAVMLYCQYSRVDGRALLCTIARHLLVSRQLREHRNDPRLGRNPDSGSLRARVLLGKMVLSLRSKLCPT